MWKGGGGCELAIVPSNILNDWTINRFICVLYLYIYLLSISVYLSLCSQNYHLYLYHIYIYPCTYIYLSSIYGSIYGQTLFSASLMIRSILWLQGRQRRSQGPRHWNLKIRLHGSIKIKSHRLSGPSRVNSWTCGAFIHETAWSDFKLEIENLARMFMEQLGTEFKNEFEQRVLIWVSNKLDRGTCWIQ